MKKFFFLIIILLSGTFLGCSYDYGKPGMYYNYGYYGRNSYGYTNIGIRQGRYSTVNTNICTRDFCVRTGRRNFYFRWFGHGRNRVNVYISGH